MPPVNGLFALFEILLDLFSSPFDGGRIVANVANVEDKFSDFNASESNLLEKREIVTSSHFFNSFSKATRSSRTWGKYFTVS
jgi:hypothetical protein